LHGEEARTSGPSLSSNTLQVRMPYATTRVGAPPTLRRYLPPLLTERNCSTQDRGKVASEQEKQVVGPLAQLVAHLHDAQGVTGSSPVRPTRKVQVRRLVRGRGGPMM
jgi:hypothetical protein